MELLAILTLVPTEVAAVIPAVVAVIASFVTTIMTVILALFVAAVVTRLGRGGSGGAHGGGGQDRGHRGGENLLHGMSPSAVESFDLPALWRPAAEAGLNRRRHLPFRPGPPFSLNQAATDCSDAGGMARPTASRPPGTRLIISARAPKSMGLVR